VYLRAIRRAFLLSESGTIISLSGFLSRKITVNLYNRYELYRNRDKKSKIKEQKYKLKSKKNTFSISNPIGGYGTLAGHAGINL
jgi:hypothetical protein